MPNSIERSAKSIFNLPNVITMARILAVPFFIWSLVAIPADEMARWFSVLVFIVIMVSDGIDGAIARKRGLITNLGKLLDPIADKALLSGGLIALSWLGEFPWWATVVILVRELGITIYRLVVVKKRVIAASSGGKLKTVLQSVLVGFVASPIVAFVGDLAVIFEWLLLYSVVAITLYSGIQYVVAAIKASK